MSTSGPAGEARGHPRPGPPSPQNRHGTEYPSRDTIVITIDGPAGTGKSSVAQAVARRLGLDFLDTGAMYRAAAAIVIDRRIPFDDAARIVREVVEADIHFDWSCDPPRILAGGRPVDQRIRDEDVTAIVSQIAAIPELRRHMVAKQRLIASQHRRLVSEGRDQGTAAFPDAVVKFYLDAAPEVRAARRAEQLRAAGQPADLPALIRQIQARDQLDASRPVGPLRCPPDAIRVDTTRMSFDEVVDHLVMLVRARVPELAHSL